MLSFLTASKNFLRNQKNFCFPTKVSSFYTKKENFKFEQFYPPYIIDKQADFKVRNDIKKLLQTYKGKEGINLITQMPEPDFDEPRNNNLEVNKYGFITFGVIVLFTGFGMIILRRSFFIKK